MSFFDSAKDAVTNAADEHSDQVSAGLDKAGEFVDEKTGGKFSDQIDAGTDKVADALGVDASGSAGDENQGENQGPEGDGGQEGQDQQN